MQEGTGFCPAAEVLGRSPDDWRRLAYHEGGHAVLAYLGHRGVQTVTLLPTVGSAGRRSARGSVTLGDGQFDAIALAAGFVAQAMATAPGWVWQDELDRLVGWWWVDLWQEAVCALERTQDGDPWREEYEARLDVAERRLAEDVVKLLYLCPPDPDGAPDLKGAFRDATLILGLPWVWGKVERLAAALLARHELTGQEMAAILSAPAPPVGLVPPRHDTPVVTAARDADTAPTTTTFRERAVPRARRPGRAGRGAGQVRGGKGM